MSSRVPDGGALTLWAPAKINLTLDIKGLRPDGFHEIATVYQALALADRLEVRLRWESGHLPTITVAVDDEAVPAGSANLAHRAVASVLAAIGRTTGPAGLSPRVEVVIAKAIPPAAGLGGGSSDAAAALKALNRLLGNPLDRLTLDRLAAGLGSDVPFFLHGGTALGRGRGEIIESLPGAPAFHVVLVKAGDKTSTAEVYARYDALARAGGDRPGRNGGSAPTGWPDRTNRAVQAIVRQDAGALAAAVGNDLAAAVRAAEPRVTAAEAALAASGAVAVAVSGAGPVVFGLFPDQALAETARGRLAVEFPWTALTRFSVTAGDH